MRLDLRVTTERGETLNQIGMDFWTGGRVANDECFIGEIRPFEGLFFDQRMRVGQDYKNALRPEIGGFAVGPGAAAGEECHVQSKLADRGDMLGWSSIDEVDAHLRVFLIVGAKQIGQEAGGEGREDADLDLPALDPPDSSDVPGALIDLLKGLACTAQETLSR
ncbi:hypothetical protein ASE66_19195 [Bosea sp. Root483D1]|nr:hypothetical protein ASE66_19195 [Bosea sp. Root483D1]